MWPIFRKTGRISAILEGKEFVASNFKVKKQTKQKKKKKQKKKTPKNNKKQMLIYHSGGHFLPRIYWK